MGFFDFVKDVISSDSSAAKKIKEAIESGNPGVKNLGVTFERGVATLSGHCDSGDAHKNVVRLARGCPGVLDVVIDDLSFNETKPSATFAAGVNAAAAATKPVVEPVGGGDTAKSGVEPKFEEYVIQSGDTLGKLAKKYYGDAMKYPKIFEANPGVIKDPNKIYVGQKIRIPLD